MATTIEKEEYTIVMRIVEMIIEDKMGMNLKGVEGEGKKRNSCGINL